LLSFEGCSGWKLSKWPTQLTLKRDVAATCIALMHA
jgi:hypothetical protein